MKPASADVILAQRVVDHTAITHENAFVLARSALFFAAKLRAETGTQVSEDVWSYTIRMEASAPRIVSNGIVLAALSLPLDGRRRSPFARLIGR